MAKIQDYSIPRFLYRYRAITGCRLAREVQAIRERYLWCSPLLELNDPMEGLYDADQDTRKYENNEIAFRQLREAKLLKRICSLSADYDHELMWAHYTDQFKGICIEYDVKDLLATLPEDVDLIRVYYTKSPPSITIEELDTDRAVGRILSNKSRNWEYEKEWRLMSPVSRLEYTNQCVRRIFVGSRIAGEDLGRLRNGLRGENIDIRLMSVNGYRLRFNTVPVASWDVPPRHHQRS